MIQAKQELLQALAAALGELAPDAPPAAFESPKQASHGDLAVTAAMQLARSAKRNPRELAGALVEALQRQAAVQRWVASSTCGWCRPRARPSSPRCCAPGPALASAQPTAAS